MFSPYLKRIIIDICLFIALALGIFYFYKVFLDFLISLFHFDDKVNLPSLAYCIQRFLYVLVPLIMLVSIRHMGKMRILKKMFLIIGICYLVGNTWIFYYMFNNNPADLFIASVPQWFANGDFGVMVNQAWDNVYLYQYNNALVFNYLIWDSYDLFGVVFSTVQGLLYISLANNLDGSRFYVVKKYAIVHIMLLILPWIYNIAVRKSYAMSDEWINRNAMLVLDSVLIFIALHFAADSRTFWDDVMW